MGKKSRMKKERQQGKVYDSFSPTWMDQDGIHALIPEDQIDDDQTDKITQKFQESIKNSPMWKEMVDEFGEQKAQELLEQCKAEFR